MTRATSFVGPGHAHGRPITDTVILDFAARSAGVANVTGVKGAVIEIALHRPARLRTDDLLVLDDGTLVEVVAAPEALIEVRTADAATLMRLAWHLGDRHIAVQLLPNRLRALRDPAVESLLTQLGAKVAPLQAPFEPEGGAYAAHHDHAHHDHHVHDEHCDHGHHHD